MQASGQIEKTWLIIISSQSNVNLWVESKDKADALQCYTYNLPASKMKLEVKPYSNFEDMASREWLPLVVFMPKSVWIVGLFGSSAVKRQREIKKPWPQFELGISGSLFRCYHNCGMKFSRPWPKPLMQL